MNTDKQRIAIAEACGYSGFNKAHDDPDFIWAMMLNGKRAMNPRKLWAVPDYVADLNAMHEAENCPGVIVGPAEWDKYCDSLRWVITRDIEKRGGPGSICGIVILEMAVSATAAQRAEAFLRTIGKWEDS